MKRITFLPLLLAGACAFAQEPAEAPVPAEPSAEDVKTASDDLMTRIDALGINDLQKDFDAWAAERGVTFGEVVAKGRLYATGKATVSRKPGEPGFMDARAAAYQEAVQDAVVALVVDATGHELTRTEREEFSDDSEGVLEPAASPDDAAARIAKKTDALAEAELDARLVEAGVDPADYADKTPAQKRALYRDSIVRSSVVRAMGNCSGYVPVQSFESHNAAGTYTIGVVIRTGTDLAGYVKCMAAKVRPALPGPAGISLSEAIPPDDELAMEQGVRFLFDEKGSPVLLSYGQAGVSYTGTDDKRLARAVESAKNFAEAAANANITEFLNSRVSFKQSSEQGQTVAEDASFFEGGDGFREEADRLIKVMSKAYTVTGSDTLKGRSTVARKIVKHPSGLPVAVVVRAWTFDQVENVDKMEKARAGKPVSAPGAASGTNPEAPGVRRGRNYDF